jgi:hypothetical protein
MARCQDGGVMKAALRLVVPVILLGYAPLAARVARKSPPPRIAAEPLLGATAMSLEGSSRILLLHNAERATLRLPPLMWDEALAQDARGWAQDLARSGRFEHSPPDTRKGQGENLFMGTAGAYPLDEMIGDFLAERVDFKPGRFPDVARRGTWHDIGHYTQIIWRKTTRLGCAIARARGQDVLVCRYSPAGNVMGQMVP